jgi:hypothetical protein
MVSSHVPVYSLVPWSQKKRRIRLLREDCDLGDRTFIVPVQARNSVRDTSPLNSDAIYALYGREKLQTLAARSAGRWVHGRTRFGTRDGGPMALLKPAASLRPFL